MQREIRTKLAIFLILTALLSALFHVLIAGVGTLGGEGTLYTIGLMWTPGIAAVAAQLITEGTLGGLGWRWGKTRYQLLSLGLPLLLVLVTYGIVWTTGLGGFPNPTFVEEIAEQLDFAAPDAQIIVIYVLTSSLFGLVTTSFTALGEEIGWRGLLVPQLYKATGFTGTALISGIIWAVWHYPGMIFADYRSNAPLWYAMLCFTIMVMGFSVVLAWIRIKSGSVWTAMFLHASHNVFIQTIFNPLTADTGPTEYVIDEFGAGLAIAYAVTAWIFWRMRDRLPQSDLASSGE